MLVRRKEEEFRLAAEMKAKAEQEKARELEKQSLDAFLSDINSVPTPTQLEPLLPPPEEDLLNSFFAEVTENAAEEKPVIATGEKLMTEKYMNQDLGTSIDQVQRLAGGSTFEWSDQ